MLEKNTSINGYLTSLQFYPQLSHDQLVELFKTYEKGGKDAVIARKTLTESNLRLVVYVAKKQKSHNIPMEDLIQEGNLGLLKAIERFDWTKGFRFSTYATWWIKQAISQFVLKRKKIIRLPAHVASAQKKMIEATSAFKELTGCEPSAEEISSLIDVSETVVKATMHSNKSIVSIHQPESTDPNAPTYEEKLEDLNINNDPYNFLAKKEMIQIVRKVMNTLSAKEIAILRLRFGLYDDVNASEFETTEEQRRLISSGTGLTNDS